MKDWKSSLKSSLTNDKKLKLLSFVIIPFVAFVLIVLMIVVNKRSDGNDSDQQKAGGVESTIDSNTIEGAGADSSAGLEENGRLGADLLPEAELRMRADEPLQQDMPAEIITLMETFFQAKLSCDTQAIKQIFGGQDIGDEQVLAQTLTQQTELIEEYQNITCFTKPGITADSYVVFTRFDVKFRETDTLAPGLLWSYAVKGQDGNFTIAGQPDEQVSSYINMVKQSEDVRNLSGQVDEALTEAIALDRKLADIYNMLRTGVTD